MVCRRHPGSGGTVALRQVRQRHHAICISPSNPRHTPWRGFGYFGGCVPLKGGIALSTARMKRIKEINENDFVAVVQPGVIPADLQAKAEAKGLVLSA